MIEGIKRQGQVRGQICHFPLPSFGTLLLSHYFPKFTKNSPIYTPTWIKYLYQQLHLIFTRFKKPCICKHMFYKMYELKKTNVITT